MRTAECCEYKLTAVWLTVINFHSCDLFVNVNDGRHIGEVEFRVYALGIHIHAECYNVNITCSFAVSEKSSFDSVTACEQAHFTVGNRTTSVIVRVEGNNKVFPVVEVVAHIFNLICVHMRH